MKPSWTEAWSSRPQQPVRALETQNHRVLGRGRLRRGRRRRTLGLGRERLGPLAVGGGQRELRDVRGRHHHVLRGRALDTVRQTPWGLGLQRKIVQR